MATSPKPQGSSARPKRTASRLLLAFLLLAGTSIFVLFILMAFGRVSGFELSPDTLKLRSFSYWQLPIVNVQITPANRARITTQLETYLQRQQFIGARQPSDSKKSVGVRWDVVSARGSRLNYEGDAEILRHYLQLDDGLGKNPWVVWSEANPDLARTLWPQVVDAISKRHYIAIPQMLRLAESSRDAAELSSALDRLDRDSSAWIAELDRQTTPTTIDPPGHSP